ncbi:MAG: hypothetical protein ACLFQV_04005 [Vulcanimicrobiota bacterium]
MKNFFLALKNEIEEWSVGKNWWVRLPFLLFFLYIFARHLQDPLYNSIFGGINLGIHEFGHVVTIPLGQFIHVISGTLFQLALPIYGMYNFIKLRDYFSMVMCFGWLSTNFFYVSTYQYDAWVQKLPLLSLGFGSPIHDWRYIFKKFHVLKYYAQISAFSKFLAIVTMLICIGLGIWILWLMATRRKTELKEYDYKFDENKVSSDFLE